MRNYASMRPRRYIDKKIISRAIGPVGWAVYDYLESGPYSEMLGIYYLPLSSIGHDLNMQPNEVHSVMTRLIELGMCRYDIDSEVVWVIDSVLAQVGDSLNTKDKRAKGVQAAYDALPDNPYLTDFFKRHSQAFKMTHWRESTIENALASPLEAPYKPLARALVAPTKPDHDHDQNMNRSSQNTNTNTDADDVIDSVDALKKLAVEHGIENTNLAKASRQRFEQLQKQRPVMHSEFLKALSHCVPGEGLGRVLIHLEEKVRIPEHSGPSPPSHSRTIDDALESQVRFALSMAGYSAYSMPRECVFLATECAEVMGMEQFKLLANASQEANPGNTNFEPLLCALAGIIRGRKQHATQGVQHA